MSNNKNPAATQHILCRDFETRSTISLRDVGAWRYATHPDTDVLCCAFAVDDEPVQLWIPGDPVPPEFIEAASDPTWIVSAFNDNFERQVEQHILAPRYGWPIVPIERHRCLQASALAHALPASLDKVAEALELPHQKDTAGKANMMALSRPRKPRKDEAPGVCWHDDESRLERLRSYCKQDVETERALYHQIGFLSPEEQLVWQLDQQINDRGIHIDSELATGAIRIDEAAHAEIDAQISKITAGDVTSVHQTARLIAWLGANGCAVDNVQKGTLGHAFTRTSIPPEARRVMELRRDGAHAAAGKYATMMDWRSVEDGRARGCFRYHGASTGRWTSIGLQLQNLKRDPPGGSDPTTISAVKSGDLSQLRKLHPDNPLAIVGEVARAALIATPGHRFIIADFSGIEARVLAWLAGERSEIDAWAELDRKGLAEDEPYYITGKAMGLDRDGGKTATLAFGYMGGAGAFRKLAPDSTATEEEIKGYQYAWRSSHPAICKFWGEINRAAINSVQHPSQAFEVNPRLSFIYEGDFLRMRLPSGRELSYPFPRLMVTDREDLCIVYKDASGGKWTDCKHHGQLGSWPGGWTENAVSAVARDLLAAAMPRLESCGYPIVLHAHDEVVAEVPDGVGRVDEFLEIITAKPDWATGLPIAAKGRNGQRFCKVQPQEMGEERDQLCKIANAGNPAPEEAAPEEDEIESAGFPAPREPHGPVPEIAAETTNTCDEAPNTPNGDFGVEHTFRVDDNTTSNTMTHNSDGSGDPTAKGNGEDRKDKGPYVYGASFIYKDTNGRPVLRKTRRTDRFGEKDFVLSKWENGRWVPGAPEGWLGVPYRLPELLATPLNVPVFICAGEKDADSVAACGYAATTNSGGETKGKWIPELNPLFKDRTQIYVLEDNDKTGREHVIEVAENLRPFVGEIRIVDFRGEVPHQGDVSDWLAQDHAKEELLEKAKAGRGPFKLCGFNPADWAGDPEPEERLWITPDYILDRTTTMLSGDGGTGKSYLAHQLTIARALIRKWIGLEVTPGKTLYLSCEDDLEEMKRRQRGILRFYDAEWDDLRDNVRLVDLVGEDSILALLKKSIVEPAPMYHALDELMSESGQG